MHALVTFKTLQLIERPLERPSGGYETKFVESVRAQRRQARSSSLATRFTTSVADQ